jgi:hypothetical protein
MAEPEESESPTLVVVLPERLLAERGTLSPTGVVFGVTLDDAQGLGPDALAAWFGWTPAELQALRQRGEHLVAVIFTGGSEAGWATAEGLGGLARACVPALRDQGLEALATAASVSSASAAALGLGEIQAQLAEIFGLRPTVFGTDRIGFRGSEPAPGRFVIDEKVRIGAANPLAEGSALPLDAYPEVPTVIRLPWDNGR